MMEKDKTKKKRKKRDAESCEIDENALSDAESEESQLKPARPKIGEDDDNLQQRAEWFQKRSGGAPKNK